MRTRASARRWWRHHRKGAFLAVPTAAVVLNVLAELRADDGGRLPPSDAAEAPG